MHFVGMAGDEDDLSSDQLDEMDRRMGPRPNEIPGRVVMPAGLARNDDVAAAVTGVQIYTTGLMIKVELRLRTPDESLDFSGELYGHGPSTGRFLFGVALPGGRTVTNVDHQRFADSDPSSSSPTLMEHGGGGGGGRWSMSYWLSPVPPAGDIEMVMAWPNRGVPETQVVLPAQAIAEAIIAVIELWPWTPPQDDYDEDSEPDFDLPEGGWFADHVVKQLPTRPTPDGQTPN